MNPDDMTQIEAIRNQTLSTLGELANSPKPTYTIDNYRLSWNEYQNRLTRTIDWCDRKLADAAPYEFRSEATS